MSGHDDVAVCSCGWPLDLQGRCDLEVAIPECVVCDDQGCEYCPAVPEEKPPMLDPDWTPERGYSHAANLMAILAAHDAA